MPEATAGNPFTRQRDLDHGRAFVVRSDRGVVAVRGADRLTWLDALLSQRLNDLSPGHSAEALLLSPQGRVEHAMGVVDDGTTTWLLTSASTGDSLATWLDTMVFREDVVVEAITNVAVIGALGDPARAALASSGKVLVTWADPWNHVAPGGVQYAESNHPAEHWTYAEFVVFDQDLSAVASALESAGASPADVDDIDALRVAAWRPNLSTEGDQTLLPHEVDWMRTAVHLAKGCYRGQETVAKVHNLGAPPRRLVFLHLDGISETLPERGVEVYHGDEAVGTVTSVSRHYEQGPIALALMKRGVPTDVVLEVPTPEGRASASQVVIVPPTAGHAVTVEKLPRLHRVSREP